MVPIIYATNAKITVKLVLLELIVYLARSISICINLNVLFNVQIHMLYYLQAIIFALIALKVFKGAAIVLI